MFDVVFCVDLCLAVTAEAEAGGLPAVFRRFSAAMLNPRLRAIYSRGSMGAPKQSDPQLGDPPSKQVVPAKPSPPSVMSAPQNIAQLHRQSATWLIMLMLDICCWTMSVEPGRVADHANYGKLTNLYATCPDMRSCTACTVYA